MKTLFALLLAPGIALAGLSTGGGGGGAGGGDALTTNPLSQFAPTTSLQLKGVISDETGSGAAVFAISPALTTPTGIVKGDVGLGNVDNTSDTTKNSATVTLTNKAITPRTASTASSATPTPNADTTDLYILTALTDATATFGAPTGTPSAGQKLLLRITDSGGPRTLAWNSGTGGYSASTDLALPLTTTASKTMYLLFVYNATGTAKWNLLARLDNF